MRANLPTALVLAGLAASLGVLAISSASAQIQQLPETTRSEAQVNSLNSQIGSQQQTRGIQQQNQFETNQIRGQIQNAPSPIIVSPPPVTPIH
jgi:predicted PurR-regulated permease PerM